MHSAVLVEASSIAKHRISPVNVGLSLGVNRARNCAKHPKEFRAEYECLSSSLDVLRRRSLR
ncbi:MAG: hypothetical protein DCC68_15560 [Planctomycetota bacterium]|nr:MAG: hypothetical protein DCC68_15560 [Planctomycetota bacterium]